MNKTVKIIIAVAVIAIVALFVIPFIIGFITGFTSVMNSTSKLEVNSSADLMAVVDQIYEGVSIEMPAVQTLEMTDPEMMKTFTGLEDVSNVEYIAVSEPMMSSQAYSLVLAKVKDGADANAMAKTMNENIDTRKWICVTAEKVYTAASGNVICLVMTNADTAQTVFESFKTVAGSVGEVYERTSEEPEMSEDRIIDAPPATMPEDMLPGQDGLAY